tara:strand:+ start:4417 stop:4680 length:264 start_codon:yes stop_codon:yes gene_type:complete
VVAEIYESDLSKEKVGQKAYINASGFKRIYNAQVRQLGFQVKKNDLNDTDPLADKDNRIISTPYSGTSGSHRFATSYFSAGSIRIEP